MAERPISEAEISMVLDTFMYMEYKEAGEEESLQQIVEDLADHPDYGGGGLHYGEYTILKEAVKSEEIGSLEIGYQSVDMGYDSGTAACTFTTPKKDTVYVVYRGTGDGEWPDNGVGMTERTTPQQEQALRYFEDVTEQMGITPEQRLIVTGHSKGGNKAQYVTMETRYGELVDVCYSVDGQGFSEEAVQHWQREYGYEGYGQRTNKIYGIHGENDYVSVLGNSIIPPEHIRYVQTPVTKENFAGYHDIKYMFATLEYEETSGTYVSVFHGRKNRDAEGKGKLGEYGAALSEQMMALPPEKRDGCAAVIMQLMEMTKGTHKGINGEKLTLQDVGEFLWYGVPMIAQSLSRGTAGNILLTAFMQGMPMEQTVVGNVNLQVNTGSLRQLAAEQRSAAIVIRQQAEELKSRSELLPEYLKGGSAVYHWLKLSARQLEQLEEKILRIAETKELIADKYNTWEEKAVAELHG